MGFDPNAINVLVVVVDKIFLVDAVVLVVTRGK